MPESCEPECETPWTMHYHHESIRWNLYMLLRTCVWVSSTNDPCSLMTPLTTWQHGHVFFSTGPYAMREGRVLYLIVTAMGRPGTAKGFRRETPKSQAWMIQLNNHLHAHKSQSNIIYNTFCSLGGWLLQKLWVGKKTLMLPNRSMQIKLFFRSTTSTLEIRWW